MRIETLSSLVRDTESIKKCVQSIKDKANSAREEIEQMHLNVSSVSPLKHVELVKLSAHALINIESTKSLIEKTRSFDSTYSVLAQKIKTETDKKTSRSLLSIYKDLRELEGLKESSPTVVERISSLFSAFDALLFTLVDALPEVIRKESYISYLKIAKVIQKKDRRDDAYRKKMFETFLDSIERRFRENLSSSSIHNSSSFEFIIEEVSLFKPLEDVDLPEKYEIFSFAAIHYHRALYEYLDDHADTLDPNEAISVLLWTQKYYASMQELGKTKASLGPLLFAEKESQLVSRYIVVAKEKLSEWISNLAQAECKRFSQRKKAPDLDSSNCFISVGFMDLLHIIRQQLEPVYMHRKIFKEISEHILLCSESFKSSLTATMENELGLLLKDKAKNGFEEYAIAIGNSGLKFMDCLQALPFYNHASIQAIGGVFYSCFLAANDILIRYISFVVKPAAKHLFTKKWELEPVSDSLIATYKDFLSDYKETMIGYFFSLFVSSLIKATTLFYMSRLSKKHSYFAKEYLTVLVSDKRKYVSFFSSYLAKDALIEKFKMFDLFIRIVSTDNLSLLVPEAKAFASAYPKDIETTLKVFLRKMPGGGKEFADEVIKRVVNQS